MNKSLFCFPLKEDGKRVKGVTVERKLKKMGMHSSDTAELHFEDVRIPERYLIGNEGEGFMYQMMQFQEERMYAALGAITGNEKTILETIDYTRQRQAFGKSILDNQVVHFRMAELMTEVEALRSLTWKAVEMHVNGEDCTKLASMAKVKATRLTREVNDSCLQYWGGMGFMDESNISPTLSRWSPRLNRWGVQMRLCLASFQSIWAFFPVKGNSIDGDSTEM